MFAPKEVLQLLAEVSTWTRAKAGHHPETLGLNHKRQPSVRFPGMGSCAKASNAITHP